MLKQADRQIPKRVRRRDLAANTMQAPNNNTTAAAGGADVHRHLEGEFKKLEGQFETLRGQLRRAQSIASLGAAAAVIAHEFKNALTPLASYARYALDKDDKQLMTRALEVALKQSDTLTNMSERVLGLVSSDDPQYGPVNLRQVIQDAIDCMCRDLSKDGITLTVDVPDTLCVRGDHCQLQQVFFNLLINTRQAITGHNGRVTITAENSGDDQVAIRFADNGPGISAEHVDCIFEGFFSTKRPGRGGSAKSLQSGGTGLGLALCKNIVEDHGGRIGVSSEPGAGTTFTIRLPVTSR